MRFRKEILGSAAVFGLFLLIRLAAEGLRNYLTPGIPDAMSLPVEVMVLPLIWSGRDPFTTPVLLVVSLMFVLPAAVSAFLRRTPGFRLAFALFVPAAGAWSGYLAWTVRAIFFTERPYATLAALGYSLQLLLPPLLLLLGGTALGWHFARR